jgi:hypothetical protein
MTDDTQRPGADGTPCRNTTCGGTIRTVKDELGCDVMECSNYPATCDQSFYSFEHVNDAPSVIWRVITPEWQEASAQAKADNTEASND